MIDFTAQPEILDPSKPIPARTVVGRNSSIKLLPHTASSLLGATFLVQPESLDPSQPTPQRAVGAKLAHLPHTASSLFSAASFVQPESLDPSIPIPSITIR